MPAANTYSSRILQGVFGVTSTALPGLTYMVSDTKTVTTTTYTLEFGDNAKILTFSNTANVVLTIPNDLDPIAFYVVQGNTGVVTISNASSVVLYEPDSQFKTLKTQSMVAVIQFSDNEYRLFGQTQA